MKCIILDGWHKGHMYDAREVMPEIRLPRPAHTIVCDCDPNESQEFQYSATDDLYRLAFCSIDGETALYSKGGKSDAAWRNVGNLLRRERPISLHTIIDCHDDRAWQAQD